MAAAQTFLSFSNLNCSSSFKSFSPSLRFAKNLFSFPKPSPSPYSKTKICNSISDLRSTNNRCHNYPRPVKTNFSRSPRFHYFRCGNREHVAKTCRIPVRCYRCEGYGHERHRCCKKMPHRSQNSRKVAKVKDDSWMLQVSRWLESADRVDNFILDSDAVRCDNGFLESVSEYSPATISPILGNLGGCSVDINDTPVIHQSPCTPDDIHSEIRGQIPLDLSPVRLEEFENYFIIDEFEDEEITVHLVPASKEDSSFKSDIGKEIFIYMDLFKFLMYCCIQSVDGFMRAARARVCGSYNLSPFKPKMAFEKSDSSKQSQVAVPVSVKKSPKANRKAQCPIMLCGVRRSLRLHKDNSSLLVVFPWFFFGC